MKAITAVCATGASVPAVVNGRVSRQRDGENAEIKMYLSKLKDLVPFMPKNRKLSKLEIIQHVIDYICDLQSELETHPAVSNFDAAAALNEQQQQQLQQQISTSSEQLSHLNHLTSNIQQQECSHNTTTTTSSTSPPHQPRQPLCVRPSPNTILSTSSPLLTTTTHSNPISGQQTHHITINSSSYSHTTTDKTNTMERSPHC